MAGIWDEYERGFGRLDGSFWLGLQRISELTKDGDMELIVKLTDWEGKEAVARYSTFKVGVREELYKLSVRNYSGNAGDSLGWHNGMPFSTKDRDNDPYVGNCAELFKGAWWYRTCHGSNLNGADLVGTHEIYANGIIWVTWKGAYYSLKRTEWQYGASAFNPLESQ